MSERRRLDHIGEIVMAPEGSSLTTFGRFDRLNHALFTDGTGALVQALTKCGRRTGEIPGHGEVDCPECIEILTQ